MPRCPELTCSLSCILPEVRRPLQIVDIQEIDTIIPERPPDGVPRTNRPSRLVPVSHRDTFAMGYSHLTLQQGKLYGVEALVSLHTRELHGEVGARDGRHIRGDVGEGGNQGRDGDVPEVIARLHALDLVERCVSRADDRHGAACHGCAVEGRQVARVAQRLKGTDNDGEGGRAVGLEIHEEVKGLTGGRIVHAIFGRA